MTIPSGTKLGRYEIRSKIGEGESETGLFIVMEFVAGQTLRSVIAKVSSLVTFFTNAAQMAKALRAALTLMSFPVGIIKPFV